MSLGKLGMHYRSLRGSTESNFVDLMTKIRAHYSDKADMTNKPKDMKDPFWSQILDYASTLDSFFAVDPERKLLYSYLRVKHREKFRKRTRSKKVNRPTRVESSTGNASVDVPTTPKHGSDALVSRATSNPSRFASLREGPRLSQVYMFPLHLTPFNNGHTSDFTWNLASNNGSDGESSSFEDIPRTRNGKSTMPSRPVHRHSSASMGQAVRFSPYTKSATPVASASISRIASVAREPIPNITAPLSPALLRLETPPTPQMASAELHSDSDPFVRSSSGCSTPPSKDASSSPPSHWQPAQEDSLHDFLANQQPSQTHLHPIFQRYGLVSIEDLVRVANDDENREMVDQLMRDMRDDVSASLLAAKLKSRTIHTWL